MGPFGSRIKAENFVKSGVPVLKGGNLHSSYINDDECDYLTEEKADELKSSNAFEGDIVITHRGTIGQVSIIPEGAKYNRYVVSQSQLKVSLDKERVNPYYVNYFLRSRIGQHRLLSYASQVGVPAIAKASTSVRQIKVPCPPLTVQNEIVSLLQSLDHKITLNTQTNQTLEEMAQAIFKSWFVDFDPVKAKMNGEQPEGMDTATASLFPEKLVESELGLIPESWVETPLYDIADYINGAAYKKFEPNNESVGLPIVKIAELKAGISEKTGFSTVDMPAKYRLADQDILFSWSGNPDTSIDTFVWALGEAWLNQHIFKVVPKSSLSRDYVLCLLKFMRPIFADIARDKQTTGLGHVTVKDLKRLMVAVPSEALLVKFNEKVSAIIAHNFSLVKQSQNLEKLRDTLLPKLFSGEIALLRGEI
ncbi:restriction endonuclease subunit S [Photobacterium phosphoreum]|nr:restriction endonuclease subunit S [Photobacterium phosphoreum]